MIDKSENSLSEIISQLLVENQTINGEDKELYSYGIRQIGLTVLNFVTVIILGLIFKMLWQSILFVILFIPLRRYAGGYHANTRKGCYFYSVLQILITLSAIKYVPYLNILCNALLILAACGIYALAPIEDKHKSLDKTETEVFRNRAMMVMSAEMIFACIMIIAHFEQAHMVITFVFMNVCLLLLLGKKKNETLEERKSD